MAVDSVAEHDTGQVARARALARERATVLGREECAAAAALVISELVTNALLHGGGCSRTAVSATDRGLRVEVADRNHVPPLLGRPSDEGLTGRGLRLVAAVSERWGTRVEGAGKVVWAEVTGDDETAPALGEDELLALWDDPWEAGEEGQRFRVELGDVPTDLLLAAKSHVEGVVRELTLASAGARAGLTAEVPQRLADLLAAVVERFAEPRLSIKRQALDAGRRGATATNLVLHLPPDAADAAEEYVAALDEVDAYCRARRLLTLETPPQHRVFRQWYVGELVAQLRAAAAGAPVPSPVPFERRLLAELDRVAEAQRATQRAARLYSVAAALVSAGTPEAVADVVLTEGVAALGAAGGGVLLATEVETLALPGAVGYDDAVVARLRNEPRDAELPAALALRTGEPVWLESRGDRDERFPQLVDLEASTVALCAVPLQVQGQRLGALRFSFSEPRLFDEDERRFVLALAAEAAEALERAQLQESLAAVLARERTARQALDRDHRLVESLDRVGRAVTARLDLQDIVQEVTDAATDLTKAAFGAFFYNAEDDRGERYQLYTLAGAPPEAFEDFPLPRNTDVFAPTFHGEGVLRLDDVTADPRFGRNAPYFGMPEGHLPVRSYLAVPVTSSRGEVMGGLFFGHPEPGRFGPEEESLVVGIGAYAAIAMENARLYDDAQREIRTREGMLREREAVSRALERPLAPPPIPVVPGVDISAVYQPFGDALGVGGDFYDVFEVPDGRWAFVIGDVSGKGPEAAALTGLVRPTAWAAGRASGDPTRILELLNEAILRSSTERFCTAVAAVVEPAGDGLRSQVALGGHPAPVVVRADGTAARLAAQGPLIGQWPDATFPPVEVALQPGDALVLCTDGVTEGGGPQPFDDEDLLAFLAGLADQPAEVMARSLLAEAVRRRSGLRDDVAILVVRSAPSPRGGRA